MGTDSFKVIGAGLGRTGTNSLKLALETLLDGRCYHMFELMQQREGLPVWEAAVRGEEADVTLPLRGYAATVDWPGCAFWRELAAANPDAAILLSSRDAEAWWASMEQTILPILDAPAPPGDLEWDRGQEMIRGLMRLTLGEDWKNRESAIAAYVRHNEDIRREVPSARLIEWRTGEGWEPICAGLGLAVPEEPFPHENRSGDFKANVESYSTGA